MADGASGAKPPNDTVYGDWTYEQIMNGVFGTSVPDRGDVLKEPWLNFTTGSDTNPDRTEVFWAYSDGKKVAVYLSDQVTGVTAEGNNVSKSGGSKWTDWVDIPNYGLAEGAFNGRYEHLPAFNPKTFYDVQAAFNFVMGELNLLAGGMAGQYQSLKDENSSFKGKAAGAFRDLIGNVRDAMQGFYDQMGSKAKTPYDAVMGDAAQAAHNFVIDMWNAYYGWRNSGKALPWDLVMSLLNPLTDGADTTETVLVPGTGWVTLTVHHDSNYIPNFHHTKYGDLATADAWMKIEDEAKKIWIDNVELTLDGPARTAIGNLNNAYDAISNTMKPLTTPAMVPIQPDQTDPNASINKSLNDLNNNFNKNLGDLGNNFNKNLGDLGNGLNKNLGDLGNGLNKNLGDVGNGINNLGSSVNNGLNNVSDGMNNSLKNLGADIGNGPGAIKDPSGGNNDLKSAIGNGINSGLIGSGSNNGLLGNGKGINGSKKGAKGDGSLLGGTIGSSGIGSTGIGASKVKGGGMDIPPLSPKPGDSFRGVTGGTPGDLKTPGQAGIPGAPVTPGTPGAPGAPGLGGEQISSGKFVEPGTGGVAALPQEQGNGPGGIPMYPPMAGGAMGGMGAGAQQGQQERERTTWLAEEEEVWGTDPECGPGVIGRFDLDEAEEAVFTEKHDEASTRGRRRSS